MNKYIIFIIGIVGAFIVGYMFKDTKVITKVETKIEYVKVNTHSVTTTKPDGSSVTVTNSVSDSTSNSVANTKTEINVRNSTLTALYGPNTNNSHNFGAILTYNFLGRVGLGGGVMYANKATLGLVAVSFQF